MFRLPIAVAAGLAALGLACAAWAQGFSPVGVWSHSQQLPNGQPAYVIYMKFFPNGQLEEDLMVPAGEAVYTGQWQFNPQTSVLQLKYTDYNPKSVPPSLTLGQVYTVPVQVYNNSQIALADASGPMMYVRQQ